MHIPIFKISWTYTFRLYLFLVIAVENSLSCTFHVFHVSVAYVVRKKLRECRF